MLWDHIGIGFLPKGTVLKALEFIGRVDNLEVEGIQVHLSGQGTNLDEGGYKNAATAENRELLEPMMLPSNAPNLLSMHRNIIELDGIKLDDDRIIVFCCRALGNLTNTRYWCTLARLHYELK